jgi:hypothetical protein
MSLLSFIEFIELVTQFILIVIRSNKGSPSFTSPIAKIVISRNGEVKKAISKQQNLFYTKQLSFVDRLMMKKRSSSSPINDVTSINSANNNGKINAIAN